MRAFLFHIALITLFIYRPLNSQTYLPPEWYSLENGLSSESVTCLKVDDNGYLWIGTKNGLNRYDGYRFKQFIDEPSGQVTGFAQEINAIKSDQKGDLWLINGSNICRFDYKTGVITQPVKNSDLADETVNWVDICPFVNGEIWALSEKFLFLLLPGNDPKIYPIPDHQLNDGIKPTCLAADSIGNIWIGTTGGLLTFNKQQNSFQEFMSQNSQGLLSNKNINCLFFDNQNTLWIGTNNGLTRFDPIDFNFRHFFPGNSQSPLPLNNIRHIAGDQSNRLVLATDAGVVSFDINKDLFENIYVTSDFKIYEVAVDQSGIIWGASSRGIFKIRRSELSALNYTSKTSGFKLSDNQIASLGITPDNKLFIGYVTDGYDIVDLRSMQSRHYPTADGTHINGFCNFRPNSFIVVIKNDIIVHNTEHNEQKSLFSLYSFTDKKLLSDIGINCVLYDGSNNLWVGTGDGIQQIRFDSAAHIRINTLGNQNNQINIGQVFDIEQDASGNLWIGTNNGLLSYHPKKRTFYKYIPYDKELLNTENKAVYSIVPESQGVLWIGTSGGFYKFDINTLEFTVVSSDPVVMRSTIKAIAVDRINNIWVGSEKGLYYYRRNANTLLKYDLKDGLLDYSYNAICTNTDGFVYLGSQHGLSVVNTATIRSVSNPNKVMITGMRFIEKDPVEADLFNQIPDTVILRWNRKILRLDFAVLDLSRPEINQFMYTFGKSNKDPDWHHLGTVNNVILEPLSPGKYIFKVTGSNSGMIWSSSPSSVFIIIEAPFWRSTIAMFFYSIAIAFLVFMILWFWIRQFFNLSRENREREMFAKQIMMQKEELTLKNKSITDSINYAKRIQTAMLPPYKLFKSLFPSSFILYMPKDIVSGDFYWINKLNDKIFIAAVDCTGHGVPGAFMSIIGFELFRKITNIEGLSRPSDILNRLNEDFHVIFQDIDNVVLRDGMDVAFCSIDKKDMILEFSGAFNPLYLIRDNKITEIKGDRFAIGLDETNFKDQTFKNHLIPIQQGDIFYIFSDGFADQFGGPDGKKYKYRRFRHLLLNLHQLPMEKQHEILENNVMEWRGEQDQVDDILVIGIKVDF
jgi:ligand-binding sensor domain-containing protein/serine phosphatase RsbU (regulator of sigma subunit)